MLPHMTSEPSAREAPANLESVRAQMEALPGWYHNIDLGGGLVTPGRALHSIRTRELWKR